MGLYKIFKFIRLLDRLQKIERRVYVRGSKRLENDLEHQYQLAMLSWYIASACSLKLNIDKVIKYSLIHDVVEAYSGDTYFFGPRNNKKAREERSARRLKKEFPEFKDLHQLIHRYETKADLESKFVYAMDKLAPIYNIYLDNGRRWRKDKITLALLIKRKINKVSINPEAQKQFNAIIEILKRKEKKLFGKISLS